MTHHDWSLLPENPPLHQCHPLGHPGFLGLAHRPGELRLVPWTWNPRGTHGIHGSCGGSTMAPFELGVVDAFRTGILTPTNRFSGDWCSNVVAWIKGSRDPSRSSRLRTRSLLLPMLSSPAKKIVETDDAEHEEAGPGGLLLWWAVAPSGFIRSRDVLGGASGVEHTSSLEFFALMVKPDWFHVNPESSAPPIRGRQWWFMAVAAPPGREGH